MSIWRAESVLNSHKLIRQLSILFTENSMIVILQKTTISNFRNRRNDSVFSRHRERTGEYR